MLDNIKIGKFAIPRNCVTLGKGSFATVLLGHEDQEPTKKAAIKVISKKKLNSCMWGKELEILKMLSQFNQTNLVTFLHFEESRDHIFLVTEFCNGGDLEKYLNAVKVIPEPSIAHLLRNIASGLHCLKQLNIVHRDLKPANILMSFSGNRPKSFFDITFKIADFGFAKLLEEHMMTATICGSPIYMAPEIYKFRSYNYKADLWSVGVVAYQCALGKVPFCERSYEKLGRVYKDGKANLELPDVLCKELKSLLKMLLVQDADERIRFEDFYSHNFLLMHSESSTYFRRSSESSIKRETSLMKDLEKVTNKADNKFVLRRSSADNPTTDKSLLDGFVVVEHHMIPQRETCEAAKVKSSDPRKGQMKVMVTRDTQTPNQFNFHNKSSGCSVDPDPCHVKDLKRRNPNQEQKEGNTDLWTCMSLDEVDIPQVSMDFESKRMRTNAYQSFSTCNWSSGSKQSSSDSYASLTNTFDDLSDHFYSPELDEKLLMEKEEVEVLEKLEFLLKFIEFTFRLADHGGLWVAASSSSSSSSSPSSSIVSLMGTTPPIRDDDRLCLYARCLLVAVSGINCAKKAAKESHISLSRTLKKIVSGLKDLYTICLERTNEVKRHLTKEGNFGRVQSKAAETILYLFAVAAAREGARAETVKSFTECYQYYQIAYVFLHWIEMKSRQNRIHLTEYKSKIEKRLRHFQKRGAVPYDKPTY